MVKWKIFHYSGKKTGGNERSESKVPVVGCLPGPIEIFFMVWKDYLESFLQQEMKPS